MQIAPHIHRLGNGTANSYLLDEAGAVTIVDTGVPRYWRDLPAELASMGRSLADVRAVLLTHAHSDHLGYAERIRRERRVPVWIHEADAALARGDVKAQRDPGATRPMRPWPLLAFLIWAALRGGVRTPQVKEVSTFGDGATLDVPGTPRVILVPGHTAGSAVLHVASLDTAFVGDAFVTRSVVNGALGPQLAPFGADLRQALDSLARLDSLEAGLALPGHGEPWTGGIPGALAIVRRGGPKLAS